MHAAQFKPNTSHSMKRHSSRQIQRGACTQECNRVFSFELERR